MSEALADREAFDVRTSAKMLGISEPTLRRIVAQGHMPTVTIPGVRRILVSRREIERILHRSETPDVPAHLSAA